MGLVKMSGVVPAVTVPATLISSLDPVLNDNSWELIRAASDAGVASSVWSVGDCKEIVLNGTVGSLTLSNYTVCVFILGFNHNAGREGNNRIHFQIGKTALSGGTDVALCDSQYSKAISTDGYFAMNSSDTNAGGWVASYMSSIICGQTLTTNRGQFIDVVPSELAAVIKPTPKHTDCGQDGGGMVSSSYNVFFLLSEFEVFGSCSASNPDEANYQAQYAYYAAGNSKVKNNHSATSTAINWWLRSPQKSAQRFVRVEYSAFYNTCSARYSGGFAPGFCV